MNMTKEILTALAADGRSVRAEAGELIIRPGRGIAPELLTAIRERKAELLRLLAASAPTAAEPTDPLELAERLAIAGEHLAPVEATEFLFGENSTEPPPAAPSRATQAAHEADQLSLW